MAPALVGPVPMAPALRIGLGHRSAPHQRAAFLKILIVVVFILIFASLAGAGFFIMKDRGGTRNTAWALTVRVGLSVSLFLFIWFAHWMGWIQSTGLRVG